MKIFFNTFIILFLLQFVSAAEKTLPQAVRGVWLTNVDSKALNSTKNIDAAVAHCAKVGINTIFVVTWNKAMTTYPSAMVQKHSPDVRSTRCIPGRDPLKELIAVSPPEEYQSDRLVRIRILHFVSVRTAERILEVSSRLGCAQQRTETRREERLRLDERFPSRSAGVHAATGDGSGEEL
jgi:hypothetical protein